MNQSVRRWRIGLGAVWVVFLGPMLVLLVSAVAARWMYPSVIPQAFGLRGARLIWTNGPVIARSLASSTSYALAATVASFLVCVFPARVLARYEFRGRILLEALFLSPVLVPAITYGMGIHVSFIRLGLANSVVGVVLVLTAASYPYMLRSLIAGYQQIHPDIDLCARNLGAGIVVRLIRVQVPLLGPAVIAGGSIVFLAAFSEYFLVFLIGGGVVPSFTGYLFPFLAGGDRILGSALTIVFVVVPLVLFAVLDRTVHRFYRDRGME